MKDYVNVTPKTEMEEAVVSWGTLFLAALFIVGGFVVLDAIAADIMSWGL